MPAITRVRQHNLRMKHFLCPTVPGGFNRFLSSTLRRVTPGAGNVRTAFSLPFFPLKSLSQESQAHNNLPFCSKDDLHHELPGPPSLGLKGKSGTLLNQHAQPFGDKDWPPNSGVGGRESLGAEVTEQRELCT